MTDPSPPAPDFNLADGHGYILSRGPSAASRLNLQSYLWRDALSYTIHPSIPPQIRPAPTIADIATGTASWLLDVARTYPTATLHGYDIDLTQAPHRAWLPSNLTITHWDIFSDIHEKMRDDMKGVLTKLLDMLKPGGWLQWDELDCVGMCIKRPPFSSSGTEMCTPALERVMDACRAGGRHDWVLDLASVAQEVGFGEVRMERIGDRDDLVRAFGEQHLVTMEEFARGLGRVGNVEEGRTILEIVRKAYGETVAGAALSIPRVVMLGNRLR